MFAPHSTPLTDPKPMAPESPDGPSSVGDGPKYQVLQQLRKETCDG